MFDNRVYYKSIINEDGTKGNPIQVIYKLMMNSSYGKNMMKNQDFLIKIINEDNYDRYSLLNFEKIISYEELQSDGQTRYIVKESK